MKYLTSLFDLQVILIPKDLETLNYLLAQQTQRQKLNLKMITTIIIKHQNYCMANFTIRTQCFSSKNPNKKSSEKTFPGNI